MLDEPPLIVSTQLLIEFIIAYSEVSTKSCTLVCIYFHCLLYVWCVKENVSANALACRTVTMVFAQWKYFF